MCISEKHTRGPMQFSLKISAITGSSQSTGTLLVKISTREEDIDASVREQVTDIIHIKQFKINMKSKMTLFY